ncbi:MAG: P-loop ATPase, MinD superfamily [Oscillospiraceae bacterium]|jgi:MinD superfamily P-loop ATPase|nr:P-loop ATPase, MinD superfamily [Oscillospiraceae bacterium]
MKQLLILSGKGGTGKTTVAGAFIYLSKAKAYADCDVDAPNLHLILKQNETPKKSDFFGMPKAKINTDLCIHCGKCIQNCRFDAISLNIFYEVDAFACEGCGVCEAVCPSGAVSLYPTVAGELMLYTNDNTVFSTAQLKMGSGTSGKLVTEVKKQMKAAVDNADFAVIDGSPGTGCPVIASMSSASMVLIVAEPSLSGISDMERIIKTAHVFGTRIAICINKYDTNLGNSERIVAFCKANNIPFTGKIPFDRGAVKAINNGKSIVEIDCASGRAVKEVYKTTRDLLFGAQIGGVV